MTRELKGHEKGLNAKIHIDLLQMTLKKISNWKMPGHNGIFCFHLKKFTSIHDRLTLEMNTCLQGAHVPKLMNKGRTTYSQKKASKRKALNNYRLITCLLMMLKILTAQIREEISNSRRSRELFHEK